MSTSAFLAMLAAFAVAAASPGPATLAVATTAMARGARTALALSAGLSLGLAFWGLVAAVGLGAVLASSAEALFVLRLLGGLYLLWLAAKAARSALRPQDEDGEAGSTAGGRPFLRGLLLNLCNPKAVLAWMAVLAIGMGPNEGTGALALTTASCALLGAAIYAICSFAFARPSVRALYRAGRRVIEGAVAVMFGYAGARLIASRPDPS